MKSLNEKKEEFLKQHRGDYLFINYPMHNNGNDYMVTVIVEIGDRVSPLLFSERYLNYCNITYSVKSVEETNEYFNKEEGKNIEWTDYKTNQQYVKVIEKDMIKKKHIK